MKDLSKKTVMMVMQPLAQFFDSENNEKVAFVLTNLNPDFAILNLIFCVISNLRLQSERSSFALGSFKLVSLFDFGSLFHLLYETAFRSQKRARSIISKQGGSRLVQAKDIFYFVVQFYAAKS